jgi:hypothetical protein
LTPRRRSRGSSESARTGRRSYGAGASEWSRERTPGLPGGGNTRKDAEAFASLIHDVETKIFDALPDETWVYPGHGTDTSLGAERPHLPEWRARGW